MLRSLLTVLAVGVLGPLGCSPVDVDAVTWSCTTSADCGEGFLCSDAACIAADTGGRNGVFDDAVQFGVILPISEGPAAGAAVRDGVEAAFAAQNARGGVNSRQLRLVVRDDGYDPARAAEHAATFGTRRDVLAVVGGVGEHTAGPIADALLEARMAHLSLGRGAAVRPATAARYLFTPWVDHDAEIRALIAHLGARTPTVLPPNVALFAQTDGAAPDAHAIALRDVIGATTAAAPAVFGYRRGTEDVRDAIGAALEWIGGPRTTDADGLVSPAVVLGGEPAANVRFVDGLLDEFYRIRRGTSDGTEFGLSAEAVARLGRVSDPVFVMPSGLGTDALVEGLGDLGVVVTDEQGTERAICANVIATRPLPDPRGQSAAALDFADDLARANMGIAPDDAAFEGWVIGRLLIETLASMGRGLNTETFVDTLGQLSVAIGTGAPIEFSVDDRQGSDQLLASATSSDCVLEAIELDAAPPPVVEESCLGGVCDLTGTITEDLTLTADKRYRLVGGVAIGNGSDRTTLTIEPGTVILGDPQTVGYLVVRRNSRILAEGTAEQPIIFTSANPPGSRTPGDWGGLIINGNAPINGCDQAPCEQVGEGGTGFYGGADPDDDSGILRYVRVEFAGRLLSPNNELNGVAFQGVGRGTVVDYLQVHLGKDDGVEFFGGTVDVRHVLVTGAGDDSIDWVLGWQGRGQYLVVQQWPGIGDRAVEADNNEDARDASPRSQPVLSHVTLVGQSADETLGVKLREGTGATLRNFVVTGFGDACLDVDHAETFALIGAGLDVGGFLLDCATLGVDSADDPTSVDAWLRGGEAMAVGAAGLRDPTDVVAPDFRPSEDSPATAGAMSMEDAFFDAAVYRGAMGPSTDWTRGWTTNVAD